MPDAVQRHRMRSASGAASTSAPRCRRCWCIAARISRASTRSSIGSGGRGTKAPTGRRSSRWASSRALSASPGVGQPGVRGSGGGRRQRGGASGGRRLQHPGAVADEGFRRVHRRGNRARRSALRRAWLAARRPPHPPVGRRGPRQIDLRPLVARSMRNFGELLDLPRRRRSTSRGRSSSSPTSADRWSATAGCCCSSSMASTRGSHRVESFVFATRLTRITRAAADRTPRPLGRRA